MEDVVLLIPTYNERQNIELVVQKVLSAVPTGMRVLFIDDSSPDGTSDAIRGQMQTDPRISLLVREKKEGLGRAYLAGFAHALEHGANKVLCMDADLSHDPADLPQIIDALDTSDMVGGSRYVNGIRIMNWPLSRLMLSKAASWYVGLLSGMPFSDPTGGFNGYRAGFLRALRFEDIGSNGYSFQIEMKHRAWRMGFMTSEIPITFTERRSGESKMSGAIVREALWVVWKLVIQQGFRRRPKHSPHPDSVGARVDHSE